MLFYPHPIHSMNIWICQKPPTFCYKIPTFFLLFSYFDISEAPTFLLLFHMKSLESLNIEDIGRERGSYT